MPKPKSVEALQRQEQELEKQAAQTISPSDQLECPPQLPSVAKEEWHRIVGELTVLGVLSKFDRLPLAIYCGAYALWLEANDALQTYGVVIKSPSGYPVPSPYLAIRNRAEDTMLKIAADFGFTPASRTRNFSYDKRNAMQIVRDDKETGLGLEPFPL
jgi:P27 family predicted phage terminase small subunit